MSPPCLSEGALLHSIADLGSSDVDALLAAASRFEGASPAGERPSFSAGLLFLAPSLRSRVGFAAAAVRLGGSPIEVRELRQTPGMSEAESFDDTLRALSGMVDVTVVRTPFELDRDRIQGALASPCVNAGDDGHHPTQALIDLYAVNRLRGPHRELRIGVCGDLGSRSACSLLELLDLQPPAALSLIAPDGCDAPPVPIGAELQGRLTRRSPGDLADLDVLYMAGMPPGQAPDLVTADVRAAFALTEGSLRTLPADAVVLSPMPVIDEISPAARQDPRVRFFEQSDLGAFVRMAVLEAVMEGWIAGRPVAAAPG